MKKIFTTALLLATISITGIVEASAYETGDHFYMGTYEQDGDPSNGAEPIEWRVLGRNEEGLFVISEYGLDALPYHSERVYVTWENSDIRNWLNNEFYMNAFSEQEKEKILDTYITTADSYTNISAGNDTIDKVFLLSVQEAVEYYEIPEDKAAHPTKQAFLNGCYASDGINMYMIKEVGEAWGREEGTYKTEYSPETFCPWWMRNSGREEDMKAIVLANGHTEVIGDGEDVLYNAVRPVMRVSLDFE